MTPIGWLAVALGLSLLANGVQVGLTINRADAVEAATDTVDAALAPVLKEQERLSEFMNAERLEPFCDSRASSFDLLMCSYKECVNRQAAQGQVASKECGDLAARILARDEWALCSPIEDKTERSRCFELL